MATKDTNPMTEKQRTDLFDQVFSAPPAGAEETGPMTLGPHNIPISRPRLDAVSAAVLLEASAEHLGRKDLEIAHLGVLLETERGRSKNARSEAVKMMIDRDTHKSTIRNLETLCVSLRAEIGKLKRRGGKRVKR